MSKVNDKTYILFGPRVSETTKTAVRDKFKADEISVDFGPFNSGAIHCELFPFLKNERAGKTREEIAERYRAGCEKLKGSHVIVIESTGEQPHVSDSIERVRCATSTLKKYGAKEVTLAMANTAYDRQDRDFEEQGRFCSVNAEWFAKELKLRGADHIVTFEPHSKATMAYWQNEFGKKNYHALDATTLFAGDIKRRFPDPANLVLGAPDGADKPNDRGQLRARALAAAALGVSEQEADRHLFKIGKIHTGASDTKVKSFAGDVAGKDCIIVDDMCDGGGTMVNATRTLKEHSARSVTTYATHAICTEENVTLESSLKKLCARDKDGSPIIDHLIFTDTVPEIEQKIAALAPENRSRVSVVSVGPMLADKLEQLSAHINTHATRVSTVTRIRKMGE